MRKKISFGCRMALALTICASAVAGSGYWTEVPLNAANVTVEYSKNPMVAFARGGDRLWKSIDGGVTWNISPHVQNTAFYGFTTDPTDENLVLVLTSYSGGLLRSTNAGGGYTTFAVPDLDDLKFSPDGLVVYGLRDFAPYLYRSLDKGQTWAAIANAGLPPFPSAGGVIPAPREIAIHPTNANIFYLGFRQAGTQGIYKTVDGGTTFTASMGLPNIDVYDIAIDRANPDKVYIATTTGLYRSVDAGVTWTKVPDPSATGVATISMSAVAFDPLDTNIIYAGGAERGEIFRSADGGASWTSRGSGVVASAINSLAPQPGVSGVLLAGTSHTMYRTANAGQSWSVSATGIQAASVSSILNGSKLRVGLADGGIYESDDGNNWTPLNNAALRASLPDRRFYPVKGLSEPGKLFVIFEGHGDMTSSSDGGATWAPRIPTFNSLRNGSAGGFITESGAGPVHYATSYSGIEKSTDDGVSWSYANAGMPSPLVTKLAKKADGSVLFAGMFADGLYKSVDHGNSWTSIGAGLPTQNSRIIRELVYDDTSNVLLIGTNDGVWITRDDGATYSALASPTPGTQASVGGLLVENFDHGAIYMGTWGAVYRSVDRGVTWQELNALVTPSTFKYVTALAGDGPGVIYAGFSQSGLEVLTIAPDLQIGEFVPAAGTYPIGTQLPLRFGISNLGGYPTTFTKVRWQLPANIAVSHIVPERGTCSVSPARLLECDIGVMEVPLYLTIDMTLTGISGGVVTLNPSVAAAEHDGWPDNNSSMDTGVRFVEHGDLAATLTRSRASVNSGETFDYTLTIHNNGPDLATGASFQTTFDARDQYVLAQGSVAGCTGNAAGTLSCPLPALASGASATWRWTVTAIPAGARSASAVVAVNAGNTIDAQSANNSSATTLDVVAVNDLSLALSANATAVTRGTSVTYTLTTTNLGVIAATAVKPRLTIAAGLRQASATGAPCSAVANIVTCDAGTLAPGASNVVAITVDTLATGSLTVGADVSSANPDPNSANNSASASLLIAPLSDVGIALAGSATAATQNTQFSYTLTATNSTGSDATAATAHVTLSNLLTFVSAGGACTHAAGIVTCDLGTLATGASLAVTINVTAASVGTAASTANIVGTAMDPVVTNNSAAAVAVTITAPPAPPAPPSSSSGGKGGGGAFDYASVLALLALCAWRRRAVAARAPV